jgi:hypothetical protein
MRWLFADPNHAEEGPRVRQTVAAIDRGWQAFQSKTTDLEALFKRKSDWNLPQFMEDSLQAIHPQLMWEFGAAQRQPGHRLVITPEGQRWLRPMVRTILERAPKLAGWEFYPYRLAESPEMTIETVKSRVGVDISGALIDASVAPGRKVDLAYAFPGWTDIDEQTAMHAAFVATETLMGEQVLDTWIGSIGLAEPGRNPGARPLTLQRAQSTVAALIRGSIDQLPAIRTQDIADGDNWATVKLEPPEPADDYAGRSDLIVASTHDVELFQAIHCGQPFSSSCHSKLGEMFCYLKLDGVDVPRERFVEFRSNFEDALNPALVTAGGGCCVGGGSGLRYAYVDLALADLKRAVPIIRKILAEHQAPVRSWLLFHDDDLAAEWIGIYPQTPPPPEASAEGE